MKTQPNITRREYVKWLARAGGAAALLGPTTHGLGQMIPTIGAIAGSRRRSAAPSGPWWDVAGQTCVVAYQPKGASSLANSYLNLKNPGTNNAFAGTAPTWNATDGWIFAAASLQRLFCGVIPVSGATLIARFSGASAAISSFLGGIADAGNIRCYLAPFANASQRGYGGGGEVAITPSISSGVMAIAARQPYLDGVADGSQVAAWSGSSRQIYIGAVNAYDSPYHYFNGNIQAFAVYSTTFSAGEIATITTAMNAL